MSRRWKEPYRDPNYYGTAIPQQVSAMGKSKWAYFQNRKGANSNRRQHNRAMKKLRLRGERARSGTQFAVGDDPVAKAKREAFIAAHQPKNFPTARDAATQHSHATTCEARTGSNPVAGLTAAMPNVMVQRSSPSDLEDSPFGPRRNNPGSRVGQPALEPMSEKQNCAQCG